MHQPLNGKAFQLEIGKGRDLRLVDTQTPGGSGLGDTPPLQDLVDRKREANLRLALSASANPRSAKTFPELGVTIGSFSFLGITLRYFLRDCFKRSETNSKSRRAVLIALGDFF